MKTPKLNKNNSNKIKLPLKNLKINVKRMLCKLWWNYKAQK